MTGQRGGLPAQQVGDLRLKDQLESGEEGHDEDDVDERAIGDASVAPDPEPDAGGHEGEKEQALGEGVGVDEPGGEEEGEFEGVDAGKEEDGGAHEDGFGKSLGQEEERDEGAGTVGEG